MYDIILLIVFSSFIVWFLYTKRKNLKREGILYLYKTSWGIKLINYVGTKYKRTLKVLSYISIGIGYILMIGIIYLFAQIIYLYAAFPGIVRAIKIPPIMPLIPYLPSIFKLDFLPPFYFTYWIVILAIIAVTHEFAHGIFAKRYNIGIKSTGFGFLGPFLAAFVELDEKKMVKEKKFKQLAILSAGTFANVLTSILFFFIIWWFFSMSFTPSGVIFDTYPYSIININDIISVGNTALNSPTYEDVLNNIEGEEFNKIEVDSGSYKINKAYLEMQKVQNAELFQQGKLILYDDAPAINAGLDGVIMEINGVKITDVEKLGKELEKYAPGDEIKIKVKNDEEILEHLIVLGKTPANPSKAWLGVGFIDRQGRGILSKTYILLASFKKEHVYYEPKFEVSLFIYNLLWWVILISISVALVNMLPAGIFDGGRFFYLTVLAFVKNEKTANKISSWATKVCLILILLLMIFWGISFI